MPTISNQDFGRPYVSFSPALPVGQEILIRPRCFTGWTNTCFGLEFLLECRDPTKGDPFFAERLCEPEIAVCRLSGSRKEEIEILKKINHEHCIKFMGSYGDAGDIGVVMDPVADCNLESFLDDFDHRKQGNYMILASFFGCLAGTLRGA